MRWAILSAVVLPGGSSGFTAQGVNFEGTNTYLTRGAELTGVSDGNSGLVSVWFRPGADGVRKDIFNTTNGRVFLALGSGNTLSLFVRRADATNIFARSTTPTYLVAGGWHHVVASWELDATPQGFLYVDDAVPAFGTDITIAGDADYTDTDWGIGANPAGANKWNGDLADLYFSTEFIDLSVEANRRKFISASKKPVDLGEDGSLPTGNAPAIFLSGPVADWHTNKGTGEGFTENGTLTASSANP